MSKSKPPLSLFEFLEEAELQQHYSSLKNVLQVHQVHQLKYVVEDDLLNVGLSRPEARRLRTFYQKACPSQNYASKLKRFLMPPTGGASIRRRNNSEDDEARQEFLLAEEEEAGVFRRDRRRYSTMSNIKVPSQHIIPSSSIVSQKELGCGEFGVVQQGIWTDEEQMRHQVAIKCLSKERMQNNTFEFMKEYDFMQAIDHPNVVRLCGVVLDAPQIMIITELAPLRSLLECLKEPSLRATFTVSCLANFAVQICQGMGYLESKRLIHRDLAARNILVFSKNVVKVSDFGLSRALGVGKDYYQTNFNVNLKLPIAWCAPECINFLKFTSSSDVWSFGVTLWEMFSYGFQPWAALTGQQILEAVDEPKCQRLEQPVHCPKEFYNLMLQMWRHEPSHRPSFEQLKSMVEDAKPEQVQAVVNQSQDDLLDFRVGDVITVLDKGPQLWNGCLSSGKVGPFSPTSTVAYVGTLPSQGNHSRWQIEDTYQSFQRSSLRGSKGKRKISRDMISGPRGEVQHTGHVGVDGAFFGDVGGFGTGWNTKIGNETIKGKKELCRADSDASERAPLINMGCNKNVEENSRAISHNNNANQGVNGANKNPRMGYAIGYLRKNHNSEPGNKNQISAPIVSNGNNVHNKHDYQTISDEEFGGPLDLGRSLMDEVFSELKSKSEEDRKEDHEDDDDEEEEEEEKLVRKLDAKRLGQSMKDVRDLVSSTLTMTSKRQNKKKQATVKPIKASDEKQIDDAIAMANVLASKSMQDLDKRHYEEDDFYNSPPVQSPVTPNSKKFNFRFPKSGKSSPKRERKNFSDVAEEKANMGSLLTPGTKDAYKALIEGNVEKSCQPLPSANPLPLPPKSEKLILAEPPKRHVRKNPLIIPSGMAASLLRREAMDVPDTQDDFKVPEIPVASNTTSVPYSTFPEPLTTTMRQSSVPDASLSLTSRMTQSMTLSSRHSFPEPSDDFENEIACSMDALDHIGQDQQIKVTESTSNEDIPTKSKSKNARNGDFDEVRIMKKVLGLSLDSSQCVSALDSTDWNVHHAIKLIKIKNLIKAPTITDTEMKIALQMRDWDVAKAANVLMKKIKE